MALNVFTLSVCFQVKTQPEWIPKELNAKADFPSHIRDVDNWMLNPEVFLESDEVWGPLAVDRFANFQNFQLSRFNSRYWNPGSEAVDAFTVN